MAAPVRIAAIDAGSNGIRLVVAQATSATEIEILESVRAPVRLGHRAFTARRLSRATIEEAVRAFRGFGTVLDRYGVQRFRAVATSAAREAQNRDVLLRRIRRAAGIELEVIHSSEEARLVRSAILGAVGEKLTPRLIVDLGGGSLEISLMRKRAPEKIMALPLGSVRLMETLKLFGPFSEDQCDRVDHRVSSLLQSFWPAPPDLSSALAVGSGGNAEAFARIFPGPRTNGIPSVNLRLLRERVWEILRLDVEERMEHFHVRRDRAEVLGVAAIVFAALCRHLRLRTMLVPGVGVKEGILWDLAGAHFSALSPSAYAARFQPLLREARRVASRFHCEGTHAEHVRKLAVELFDQLEPVHNLPYELRLSLEIAAILHDAGRAINADAQHKHGEYIARNTNIPGLAEADRILVACLIRYQGSSEPDPSHKLYSSLGARRRQQVRALAGILRIALALDRDKRNTVHSVQAVTRRKQVRVSVYSPDHTSLPIAAYRRAAKLFEDEFGCRVSFGRARSIHEAERPAVRSHYAA
ncbi:MAG TPA: Ppx/GppA phosphatase family protein [Candidatus Acidoferrales bacterium]|nr:Ppx/GppA phosphatase family protein [Candidatus Acidoferrales bacterium]